MARKRMVSPELLTSETVASLPLRARYGFVALWMYLDDCGRGRDNPALIKAHTWPLDKITIANVESDLAEMDGRGLICRYQLEEIAYLHSPSWFDWQKINRPTESRVPPCESHEPEAWELFVGDCVRAHGGLTEGSRPIEVSSIQFNVVQGSAPHRCVHDDPQGVDKCPICRTQLRGVPA